MSYNLASAIDSVLVVDDEYEDVENLINELDKKYIQTTYINPIGTVDVNVKIGNTLIIMDFELVKSGTHKTNISAIRGVLEKITKDLSVYGIAFWSKHSEDYYVDDSGITTDKQLFDVLKSSIDDDIDDSDTNTRPPLYYVNITDKLDFINGSHEWSDFFNHFEKSLETSKIAAYYFKWSYLMKESVYEAFGKLNNVLADYIYSDKDKMFAFLIQQLSSVHIGYHESDNEKLANYSFRAMSGLLEDTVRLKSDAINDCKVLNDVSNDFEASNIKGEKVKIKIIKNKIQKDDQLLSTIGKLNSIYAFDFGNEYAKGAYLPGNIYMQPEGFTSNLSDDFNEQLKVLFEITPPCDFAQGNCNTPKFIEGAFCTIDVGKKISKTNFYNFLHPVDICGNSYYLIIDFNTLYVGTIENYQDYFICRAKDGLFADILQKYSSHISRLGVSFINHIKY